MILDKIVAYKKKKITQEKEIIPINQILSSIENCDARRSFKKVFEKKKGLSIIAEIKKASPSKGIIKEDFNPLDVAKIYTENQAEAISVLTEDKFFMGNTSYLNKIRAVTSAPLLRKDFIIDPYQIYQSKMLGADAILLIVSILSGNQLIEFQRIAKTLDLGCLVEVHDKFELDIALESDAEIIGINNRDLKTFKTSIETTQKLINYIPKNKIVISESGINTRNDMESLKSIGVKGVLIGESLMRSNSIENKFKELRG